MRSYIKLFKCMSRFKKMNYIVDVFGAVGITSEQTFIFDTFMGLPFFWIIFNMRISIEVYDKNAENYRILLFLVFEIKNEKFKDAVQKLYNYSERLLSDKELSSI